MRCSLILLNIMADYRKLSVAWYKQFPPATSAIKRALERTLPLLDDPTSVPFVCRYRSDIIEPLSTKQVHQLSEYVQKYDSLASLRKKILTHFQDKGNDPQIEDLIFRVETSISKAELEDIYAPFKPPSKGSLEDRIRLKHPELVKEIDDLWNGCIGSKKKFSPRESAIVLLANRIANDIDVMDAVLKYCESNMKIKTKQVGATSTSNKKNKRKENKDDKYEMYGDFQNSLKYLRDHQVLAIRRGASQKMLKCTFDIDNDIAQRIIGRVIKRSHPLYKDAISDAWTRLLRKRSTSRLWKDRCAVAEARAIEVFCQNLHKALLAPPADPSIKYILTLDPGFQAGIKCATLTSSGEVKQLETVKFLGNARQNGKKKMMELLESIYQNEDSVNVIIGNGHGTREAREFIDEVSVDSKIPINIHLVSEAGASVWSVTEMAKSEFEFETAASIATVSIGRRFLNPLHELVKIPPKSLGLGMYQHDLSEKDLNEKLSATSTDAVAFVGVDVNTCSSEILAKVPSLSASLCKRIILARPFSSRADLLNVSGLGEKTFENCAGFLNVMSDAEPLDSTLVHPESYSLAKWILKDLKWKLDDNSSVDTSLAMDKRQLLWSEVSKRASKKFDVAENRALKVTEQLWFSITNPDPRLWNGSEEVLKNDESYLTKGCSRLPQTIVTLDDLRNSIPLRSILGTCRNICDFGAFIDFGFENDGLLHRSKLGTISLDSLLVGQDVGVDILDVSKSGKIALSMHGLKLPCEDLDAIKKREKVVSRKRKRNK